MAFDLLTLMPMEAQMIFKLLLAAFLGAIIGYEREARNRPAGLRTHMLVAMGAAVFSMISFYAFPADADSGRMASYVVVGIGFIGAGTVIQLKNKVVGLTTAASLWLTAAIGVSVAIGYYFLAASAAAIGFVVLSLTPVEREIQRRTRRTKSRK